MTQEERELLLKDLSARLLYGVIVDPIDCGKAILIGIKDGGLLLFDTIRKKEYDKPWDIEYIKPYLRPMSSMTEDEKRQYRELCDEDIRQLTSVQIVHPGLKDKTSCYRSIDWLNANHFDYHRLIEKGLALEAPKDMYKIN